MSVDISRRKLVHGIAWSVPVVSIAAAAPAFAASQRNDPGINGWVQVSTTDRETQGTDTYRLRFNSNVNGAGPDGQPFGLFTKNPTVEGQPPVVVDSISNAAITLWIRTDDDTTPSNGWSNPGPGWSNAVPGALSNALGLGDTQQYRAYRFNYTGPFTLVNDGTSQNPIYRVYLNDFDTTAVINSSDATYWVERTITINGQVLSFRRRNGDDGPLGEGFPGGSFRVQSKKVAVELPV